VERFEGTLEPYRTGLVIEIPFDVKSTFGSGRPAVRGTVNGFPVRTTLMPMGGRHLLGLNRETREGAGIAAGDRVTVALELDDEPRVVEVPSDLAVALDAAPDARDFFDRLSYTHRREYAEWIAAAKLEETRRSRVERAVAMLRESVRHP